MLPPARQEQLKADIWERKLKQFGSLAGLQKKVSDCKSRPLVWQFILSDEHWIKMDVAEIQQSYCVCMEVKRAVVGVSGRQVGSPPLPAPKPLSSERAWASNLPWRHAATKLFRRWGIPHMVCVWASADA